MSTVSILELAASGKAENVVREMRVRSLYSPYYFIKVVLGYTKLVDHLHQEELEAFVERLCSGQTKQWIEWPRGYYKTTTFTIGTSIWLTLPWNDDDTSYALDSLNIPEATWFARMNLHNQDITQLLAFETIDNAKKKIGEIKWHFESNELFRNVFPEIAYTGIEAPWNNQCLKIRRTGYGQRSDEGTFEAIGVDGALQSRHYQVVWEDDLVGKKATESQVTMASTIRWHGLLSGAFENAAYQWRFGVSNRWGYDDLNSHVRAYEPDFVFYSRSAYEPDAVTGQDVAIFPELHTLSDLMRIKNSASMTDYDFACQYLNRPKLPGEKEVDTRKIHRYTVAEDGRIECNCGAKFYASQLNRYMHYDPYNAKGAASTSRPAIAVVGTSTDKHAFLLDCYMGKGSYDTVYNTLFRFNNVWRPWTFTYEDVGHQNMVEFYIRRIEKTTEFATANNRKFPRIIGVLTGNRAKEVRIRDALFPTLQHGKFSCRDTHLSFLEMLDTFPNHVPGHDYDLLDALEDGAPLWRYPVADEERTTQKNDEDEYLKHLGKPYSQMEVRYA